MASRIAATGGTRGVLVDRDGTLIREVGHLCRLEQIEILPRVPEAVQLMRRHGLKVAVVTNQSAVARGFLTEDELGQIHREIERRLALCGAFLDGIYYCPHHPTEGLGPYRVSCDCRKPNAGLARKAAADLELDLARCYVVGDQSTDVELAVRIGAKGIRIQEGKEREGASATARDLWEAAQWIVDDFEGKT